MPYLTLLFYIVSTIIEAFIVTGYQFLVIEHSRLRRQPLLHYSFDVFIVVETLANKELLQMQEQMKVTWR
jgi:hypothetical protein